MSADDRIKSLIYLPFNTPEEAERMVEEFGDEKGVIGFCITSTRYKPVHHNQYMRLYAMIEERGKPVAFHAGYHWHDPSLATINRFLGMHALGFVWCNMVHMTNWILNGIPERFPKLKTDLGRERARLGAVPDAAARRPVPDAAVRGAAAQAAAERIHARELLVHDPADGDDATSRRSKSRSR